MVKVVLLVTLLLLGTDSVFATGSDSGQIKRPVKSISIEHYDSVSFDRSIHSYHINAALGYSPWKNIELFWQGTLAKNKGYSIDAFNPTLGRMNDDSYGVGGAGLARLHILKNDWISFFADVSSGAIYFNHAYPTNGTRWNAYSKAGVGLSIQTSNKSKFNLAYRRMHISNGRMSEGNNPAINSAGFSLELVFDFK